MRKKISWLRHFGVLMMTIMIFTVGIFLGGHVESLRVESLYTQLQEQDLDYQQIVTEGNFIDYIVDQKINGENISCETLEGSYYTSISKLDDSRLKLENYINTANVKEEEYQRLKDHYANLQINYWILANKINSICPDSQMNSVLYFYANKEKCPECEDQGVHLSYVKAKLGDDVLVFSLDKEKLGPIQLIAQQYNVLSKEAPVIVIDDESYAYSTSDEVFDVLCKNGLVNEICESQ